MRTAIAASAFFVLAAAAHAQTPNQPVQVEVRADALSSRWTAVEGGIGITVPSGIYVRSGGVLAAGGGGRGFESRLDLFSRFTLDPFRENRWALYGGGGVSGRYTERNSPAAHAFLLVFAGLEGPLENASSGGWVPAIEIGLGGGARIGVSLRRGIPGRR